MSEFKYHKNTVLMRWTSCLLVLLFVSCQSSFTPRPRGYFKISFPEKTYQSFDEKGFPYSFEYPTYAEIEQDTTFFNEKPENPWWINVSFPQFNSKIYISYKVIGGKYTLNGLVNDAYEMTYKNSIKADDIVPEAFQTVHDVTGLFYSVSGDAATARQFFATDSVKNFLRGALYFYATPNEDSIKPVLNFIEKDMWHLLETLKWKPIERS